MLGLTVVEKILNRTVVHFLKSLSWILDNNQGLVKHTFIIWTSNF